MIVVREISPPEIAGMLGSFFVFLVRSGGLVSYAVSLLLPLPSKVKPIDNWWRIEISFACVFILIQLMFLSLIFIYDTPKGCFLKGDKEQGVKMLNCMFTNKERIKEEINNIEKVLEESVS